jgi:hypothetical protein
MFTNIGGQPRSHIAALDAATGLATGWDPNANNELSAIAVNGSTVYAAGVFSNIGGQTRKNVAALDANTGLATAWAPDANYRVLALAVSGSTVYGGGYFTTIGGQPRNRLAAADVASGLAAPWDPNVDAPFPFPQVSALAVSGGLIYAGGNFTGIGNLPNSYFAAISLLAPVQLSAVSSRKVHGSAGTFDVDLTNGNGIECRSGGASGDYMLVFSFVNPLTNVGSASVVSGTGSVVNNNIDSNDHHNYIVDLTGVTNAQTIKVSLTNVTDSTSAFTGTVSASMGVLLGDVNASGRVDAADVSVVRQQTLQPLTSANFREDVNASGRIDAADVSITRQQTLTMLP